MNRFQFTLSTSVALLITGLVAATLVFAAGNRELQSQVNSRQQYVQQSVQLEGLYRDIARALAELGSRNNDVQVRDMLQRHGITYTATPTAAAAAPASPTVKK